MLRVENLLLLLLTAAFGLCLLLPGHYWPWLTFQQEFTAVVAALLLGGYLLVRRAQVHWPVLAVGVLACAAIPLVQHAAGLVRFHSDAVLASLFIAGLGLCIVAGATAVANGSSVVLHRAFGALAFGAAISVGLAIFQWQGIFLGHFADTSPKGARVWANLGQPNHLASVIAIGVCAALYACQRRRLNGALTILLLAWFGFGLVAAQSRTGYAFVLMLGVGLLALRQRAGLIFRPLAIVIAVALFFAAVELWPALNTALDMAKPPGLVERIQTGSHRLTHWQVIADAISQRPLFGYGWTQVALAQHAAVANHAAAGEVLSSSHNIVLDLLVWNGVPLGLLIIGTGAFWFIRQIHGCRNAEQFFALAIACALLLHAMLEFPLEYAYFLVPFGLAVGTLEGLRRHAKPAPASKAGTAAFAGLWGVMVVMSTWILVEYTEVESTARTLRFVSMGIGVDKVSHAPEPDVVLLNRPKNLHRFMLSPARVDPDPAYLSWVRFMATRHATPPSMLRLALAEGRNGHPDEAARALVRLCKLFNERQCQQGKAAWSEAQARFPELAPIPYPDPLAR